MSDNKKNILLVEDDVFLVDILRPILISWDYEITAAGTAYEAIELIGLSHPDLIIVDTSLPDMDGFQLCKRLKENFFTENIPIIILMEKRKIRTKILNLQGGLDDYITKPPDPIDLKVRIEMALHRSARQFYASSLTKLPGSQAVGAEIERRLKTGEAFSVAYYDIDNFKSFNDRYGYLKGDAVIHQTAHIIATSIQRDNYTKDFLGHIGGDDFVLISTPERIEEVVRVSLESFDRLIPLHYPKDDRKKGYIITVNRQGKRVKFPLMSLSVAIATTAKRAMTTVAEISQVTSEIKKHLKTVQGSCYLIDRRIIERIEHAPRTEDASPVDHSEGAVPITTEVSAPTDSMLPMGQLLLKARMVKEEVLEAALRLHWATGQHLGEVLLRQGHITRAQLGEVLEQQLGSPYCDLSAQTCDMALADCLPEAWITQHRIFPLAKDEEALTLGMIDPTNHAVIAQVSDMTGCSVKPVLVLEEDMKALTKKWFAFVAERASHPEPVTETVSA